MGLALATSPSDLFSTPPNRWHLPMPTRYLRDHPVVLHGMCDVRYDENLDEDFEPDSESDVSEDDNSHHNSHHNPDGDYNEYAFHLRRVLHVNRGLWCEHQRIVTLRILTEETWFDPVPVSCLLEYLDHYKAKRAPTGFIHRSRFDDLCRCCDKLNIPQETATVAHYVYECTWKAGICGNPSEPLSKAVISASIFIACNKDNVLITPEAICDEFNALGRLFTRALTDIRRSLKSFMTKYNEWVMQDRPRKLSRWRMDDKRRKAEFFELLDRPESVRKCDYAFPRECTRRVRSAASFRSDMLASRDASYPSDQWYIPL